MQAGYARIDYTRGARNGINGIDLAAGRASNDGFGNVDTLQGTVWEVRGTDFRDVMRGSDNNESFIGRSGDDVIDGRGGFDRVRFDRECCASIANLNVDLGAGRATGTWNGSAFTYTLRSIEYVRGSNNPDTFAGKAIDGRTRSEAVAATMSSSSRATTGGTASKTSTMETS